MTPRLANTAAALLIGDELLSGKVREANLHELATTLRALGITLARVVMIPDSVGVIAREARNLSYEYDVVFSSGGIGPTHDDVTIAAMAGAFGVDLVEEPTMRALLEQQYGAPLTDVYRRMALVPAGAALATTAESPWPTVVMGNVWILPGVPEIFRLKLDAVRTWLSGPRPIHTRAVLTKLEEPAIALWLEEVVATHPRVTVGSYPKWFNSEYKTKITLDGRELPAVEAALESLLHKLPSESIVRVEA